MDNRIKIFFEKHGWTIGYECGHGFEINNTSPAGENLTCFLECDNTSADISRALRDLYFDFDAETHAKSVLSINAAKDTRQLSDVIDEATIVQSDLSVCCDRLLNLIEESDCTIVLDNDDIVELLSSDNNFIVTPGEYFSADITYKSSCDAEYHKHIEFDGTLDGLHKEIVGLYNDFSVDQFVRDAFCIYDEDVAEGIPGVIDVVEDAKDIRSMYGQLYTHMDRQITLGRFQDQSLDELISEACGGKCSVNQTKNDNRNDNRDAR